MADPTQSSSESAAAAAVVAAAGAAAKEKSSKKTWIAKRWKKMQTGTGSNLPTPSYPEGGSIGKGQTKEDFPNDRPPKCPSFSVETELYLARPQD